MLNLDVMADGTAIGVTILLLMELRTPIAEITFPFNRLTRMMLLLIYQLWFTHSMLVPYPSKINL